MDNTLKQSKHKNIDIDQNTLIEKSPNQHQQYLLVNVKLT